MIVIHDISCEKCNQHICYGIWYGDCVHYCDRCSEMMERTGEIMFD